MTCFRRFRSHRPAGQRGSILVNVGAGLSLMVILLSVIDLGFLYFHKREYQRAADLAALAGARATLDGEAAAISAANANAALNLTNFPGATATPDCGTWSAATAPRFLTATCSNAVEVIVLGRAPRFLPFIGDVQISASAIATAGSRSAALNLRSTLVSVDTSQSAALNSLFGGLLGGNVSLSAVAWDGLVNTDVSLLDYLDQLAIDLGVQAGNYDQLLQTDASVGELIDAGIALLDRGQGTGDIGAALGGLEVLRLAIPPGTPLIQLGDLIGVQSGTPATGLDAAIQVFQLVQAFVQAANAENVAVATVNLGALSVQVKVLEPPQISAIGDPELARQNPDGPDRIYVRTAQVRTLISVNLPALSGVTGLVNAVADLLAPITNLLNSVLSLNLAQTINSVLCLLGTPCDITSIQLLPGNPRIDVSLDVGGGEGKVTDYNCPGSGEKELQTDVETSLAELRVGRMEINPGAPGYVFSSDVPPSVGPLPLVDVGVQTCTRLLFLPPSCGPRRAFEGGGIGIMGQTSVAGAPFSNTFVNPPNLDQEPIYDTFATENIVDSLASTLGGVQIELYGPNGAGGLEGVLNLVGAAFNTVKGILQPLINNLLSPLLDPLVNLLLETLGLDLAQLEVGARLTCGGEAVLVE